MDRVTIARRHNSRFYYSNMVLASPQRNFCSLPAYFDNLDINSNYFLEHPIADSIRVTWCAETYSEPSVFYLSFRAASRCFSLLWNCKRLTSDIIWRRSNIVPLVYSSFSLLIFWFPETCFYIMCAFFLWISLGRFSRHSSCSKWRKQFWSRMPTPG